jgi:3-isopropylmalate/(R)-2-methylmalate dehydratase small subunit
MEPFIRISGAAAPLALPNVDTDVIIRIERLTSEKRSELGRFAFEALRYRVDGAEDPDFVLNARKFRGASILIAGPNFGCGSSREGAVWALMSMGFRCIIGTSFGDIFHSNCFENGMLAISLDASTVQSLMERAHEEATFTVDLSTEELSDGQSAIPFHIDPLRRQCLLAGLDAVGLTLRDDDKIARWQAEDRIRRPWAWSAHSAAANRC